MDGAVVSRVLRLSEEQFRALGNKHRKPRTAPTVRAQPKEYADGWPIVLRDQIVAAGLPEPYREFTFHETRGWRLDLAFADQKLAVEVDGMVHRIKGRFQSDLEKHNALTLAGWKWLRVTPAMVKDGTALELVKTFLDDVEK